MSVLNRTRRDNQQETKSALKSSVANTKTGGRSVANTNTRGRSVANTNTRGRSVANTNTRGRSVANTNTRGRSVANTNTRGRSVANTNTRRPSVANTGTGEDFGPLTRGTLPAPSRPTDGGVGGGGIGAFVGDLARRSGEVGQEWIDRTKEFGVLGAFASPAITAAEGVGATAQALNPSFRGLTRLAVGDRGTDAIDQFEASLRGQPTPQPNAPANNMTPAEFQRLRNGESLPRSEIGQQTVAPAVAEASGAPPQQPQVPGESPSGIYTFTDDNGVQTFTDQRVPGSEPYAPGGISISGGGGGGAAPQFGGVSAGPQMSAAELENTRLGQRIRQQVVGGGRLFGTQNGGTGIGGGALNRAYQQELDALDRQIQHGLTTSTPGQRLTVGGLNALMGRRNELTQAQTDLFGDQTDLAETGINAQTGLQRQQLRNQGQLDRTELQGQMSAQRLQQRINDPLNQARAQVLQQEMQQFGVSIAPPALPDPAEMSMLSENQQAQIQQRYLGELAVFSDAAELITENGGDVQAALQAADDIVAESEEDEFYKAQLKAKLGEGIAGGAFVPRQSPTGLANGGLVQGPVQNFANGGLVGGQQPGQLPTSGSPNLPAQGSADAIQNYQKYVQLTRQMKVPPVDFQQFAQMGSRQPSPNAGVPQPELQRGIAGSQRVMGFADGGLVPQGGALDQLQADEKLIMDTDPNAPTDSIPATIDGTQPARLDSGEFVMPADVVQFFGTQKLQKLIEQARKPQEPQQSEGVQSGTPA